MKALQLVAPATLALTDIPVPAITSSEVLVRVTAAGVCQTDVHIRSGQQGRVPVGLVLGHEIAGEIAAVGDAVSGWSVGDKVVVYPCWSCGVCLPCVAGRRNACLNTGGRLVPPPVPGVSVNGGMAEYVSVPATALVAIGDLAPVVAATLADAGLTSYHSVGAVRDVLVPGATAVVVGAGGLGHLALQILRALTPARVVVMDISDDALEAVRAHADVCVRSDSPDAADTVLAATGGAGADAVLDFVGVDATLRLDADMVAPYGIIRIVGQGGGHLSLQADPLTFLPRGVTVVARPYSGSFMDLRQAVALARSGDLAPAVTRYPFDQALVALDDLAAGRIHGRAVLGFS